MSNRKVVVIVGSPNGIARNRYKSMLEDPSVDLDFLLLVPDDVKDMHVRHTDFFRYIETCDFNNPASIKKALAPYSDRICAVTARSDGTVPKLIKLLPYIPKEVPVPDISSLGAALNKVLMRKAFFDYDPNVTPAFCRINSYDTLVIEKIGEDMNFPLIVKPSGFASSSFVSKVLDLNELKRDMQKVFKHASKVFSEFDREDKFEVVVEEYMQGTVYSTDAYISQDKEITFTPFVEYRNKKEGDLSPYIRITPSDLKAEDIKDALDVARKGIKALNLFSLTAHVELMKTRDGGWKIIEIGPRVGGNRDKLYTYAYGFNHAANDIFTRMQHGVATVLSKKINNSAVIFLYPEKEGIIKDIAGLDLIRALPSYKTLWKHKNIGDRYTSSKNGGSYVLKVTLVHEDKDILEEDLREIERSVHISTE